MLDLPRYLLGVAEVVALAGFALLGASAARARLLPRFEGPPAWLATGVIALALLIWTAELLGSFGWFAPLPYLVGVATVGVGTWALGRGSSRRGVTRGRGVDVATPIAVAVAIVAVVHFAAGVRTRLSTGMTGFDSTWYHGPFAAGFFQSGDTWSLHFIAPQFLAWFYPANGEIFHAVGMLAFGRDLLSPLLNLGWLLGCLLALWCIGRPYRVAPWSLALGAIALSVPALSDQAGEARNDIVGIFFLLAAVAVAVNSPAISQDFPPYGGENPGRSRGALLVAGVAAGLAAGTKLNFLLPAAVLVLGLALVAAPGSRWRTLWISGLAALAGGGYWYLRNLIHTGNPLPWFDHLGPLSLPAPEQALGGREGHSVLGYLTDSSVWRDWFLPGLHHGLTILWPLLGLLALAGLVLCLTRGGPPLRVVALVGVAAGVGWLIAPTSASGPDGMPRGFESGLRYLAPALVLGVALLPISLKLFSIGLPRRPRGADLGPSPNGRILKMPASLGRHLSGRGRPEVRTGLLLLVSVALIAVGYPIQRHYLRDRYANPSFAAPGLNAAFKWANSISNARIATTSTRQYPLFGRSLSNHVQFVGIETAHGGFVAPSTCTQWRRLLDAGDYDYVITTRDRVEPGKPAYPPTAHWTAGPWAELVLAVPPTKVYKLKGPMGPSACSR